MVVDEDRLVRAKEFYTRLAIGRTKFYSCVREGKLPQPTRISDKLVVWHNRDVQKAIDDLLSGQLKI